MAYHKKYDLACKVGTYEKNGETKNRYKNVGLILESDEVNEKTGKTQRIIMIDPTFNFAAVKREDGKDMVMVSMFGPNKDQQEQKNEEE